MYNFETYKKAFRDRTNWTTTDYVKIMDMFIMLCCEVEKHKPELLMPLYNEIHEMTFGPHYTKEMAEYDVSIMHNQDGTKGQHWSVEQTTEVAKGMGVMFGDKFNCYDFYYMMNMWYSDHKKTTNGNAEFIAEQVLEVLNDPDGVDGIAWYHGRMAHRK